jgi:hypothetical protein
VKVGKRKALLLLLIPLVLGIGGWLVVRYAVNRNQVRRQHVKPVTFQF